MGERLMIKSNSNKREMNMNDSKPQPELASAAEVAELLHTSEAGLAQLRYRGTGPKFVKVGGRKVLYRWSDVHEYLNANTMQRTDLHADTENTRRYEFAQNAKVYEAIGRAVSDAIANGHGITVGGPVDMVYDVLGEYVLTQLMKVADVKHKGWK